MCVRTCDTVRFQLFWVGVQDRAFNILRKYWFFTVVNSDQGFVATEGWRPCTSNARPKFVAQDFSASISLALVPIFSPRGGGVVELGNLMKRTQPGARLCDFARISMILEHQRKISARASAFDVWS